MSAEDGWEARFREYLVEYLIDYEDLDVAELISAYENRIFVGGCPTCDCSETVLFVVYTDTSGVRQQRTITTSFADLFGF